jgi:hypothetical protein
LGRLAGVVITIDISTETIDRLVCLAAATHNGSISQWLEDMITREVELAAESYSPPKEAMHTHHINGDHSDDRPSNLVRLTRSEHGMIHGIADQC